MHIKNFNGIEFHYIAPDSNLDEILSAIKYLKKQIEEIENYPDKSLFFQNPLIIEGWLALVRAIESNTVRDFPDNFEDLDEWSKHTEPLLSFLLRMRRLYIQYRHLYSLYYKQLNYLLDYYPKKMTGVCIHGEGMKYLSEEGYMEDFGSIENISKFLAELNVKSSKARSDVYSVLADIYHLLMAIMNRGERIVLGLNPYDIDFAKAINVDLREWTCSFGNSIFKEMKEDLNRHYKDYRTAPYTPELWGQLLDSDENALNMAKRQELSTCDDVKQEHWGEDMKKLMDENGDLMRLIYSSCHTEELFELSKAENVVPFIEFLTPDNLFMFYEIIVRRNIIQCEMYPKLKAQHDEWLNQAKDDKTESHEIPQTQVDSEEGVNNEVPAEEERFHYIHVEIEDEEAWRIHHAIKRLVANYSIPEICKYLKEQKQNGKLMLPSDSSAMYKELVRLGMPKGKGFSEKNFSNCYTK